MMAKRKALKPENGNIVTYILLALFLLGLLTLAITEGPKKSAITMQLDQMVQALNSDLNILEEVVNECILTYGEPVDIDNDGDIDTTDNPNAPYPRSFSTGSGYSNSGSLGTLVCPGKPPTPIATVGSPTNDQLVFPPTKNNFKLLGGAYNTAYFTSTTEGVYFRIYPTTAANNQLWIEAAERVNSRLNACKAVVATPIATPCTAAAPCFYYWLKRPATSTIGMPETGCTL